MDAGAGRIAHKLDYKESILPRRTQCSTGIVQESGRTIYVVGDGWYEISGLTFKSWRVHFFIHPDLITVIIRIPVFAVLPIAAPSNVSAVNNIDQTFRFSRMITIV